MRRQQVFLTLILFLSLPFTQTYANTLDIIPTLYLFNYQEFDQNNVLLDKEEGTLPGLSLSYGDVTERGSLKFDASFNGGSVDYTGQTQTGVPHETKTDTQLITFGISYYPHATILKPGLFFAGLHYWYWDRDIMSRNGVQGLHELYTWYETEIGLRFQSQQTRGSTYWLELSAMYNFKPEMELFLPSSKINFSLGSSPGYRMRAGKTWASNESMTTTIGMFAEYWEFGRSNTVFTTDFYGSSGFLTEPDSETLHSGLEFSFSYIF